MPEKGSSKSQYVVAQKAREIATEKAVKKSRAKKKFINMELNKKKFNGVIVGSDYVLSS